MNVVADRQPTFDVADDLEEQLARLVTPVVVEVTDEVNRRAKALAPGTKKWVAVLDATTCPSCAGADGQTVPDNLRFELESFAWDREHQGSGPTDYLTEPRNPAGTGTDYLVLTHHSPQRDVKNCRCRTVEDPEGISRLIRSTAPRVEPGRVVAEVVVEAPEVTGAEFGQAYPTPRLDIIAVGTRFMARAASQVAAARNAGQ